ncbi:alpha-L-rhamnosidase [hydrothermal vent metagenome]|uniref:alpha-L-rhamnosidase n=1 Tax=hydrothermal vent metagenome TaxID=652676 RepID=A0A3B1CU27_9ZZZZ
MKNIIATLILLSLIGSENYPQDNNNISLKIEKMKCEYTSTPINVDRLKPRFSWLLSSNVRGQKQTAYQVFISKNEKMTNFIWDSGKINSSSTNQILYDGKKLESNSKYFWKVRVWDKDGEVYESKTSYFETALYKHSDWTAKWIGAGPTIEPLLPNGFIKSVDEQYSLSDTIKHDGRSLLLRNEFECPQNIKNAKVYVTGLGYYEFYLNGKRVGDHVLSPAKTNYAKEVLYDTYDVTDQLQKGRNTVGIHLGNGWFNPYKKWWREYRMQWFGAKRAIMQLHVEYENGDNAIINTNENWKYNLGPVLYNCIYDGELYDATQESTNWTNINFDDSNWKTVNLVKPPGGELRSQSMQAIKVIQIIDPVKVMKPKPEVLVYDMGQNFAGWAKITVRGKRGTKLHLQFAEDINEDGTIDITSNEHAKAEATYILKGNGSETYEPRFTFYGYKYVEVTAEPSLPEIENIQGCVVHSDNKLTGQFECGNETINKIHSATVWSQKSNMIGFPFDCPQRDERLGWFGDAQVTIEEAMFNFDMPLFYNNWITGIRKNQDKVSGDIPIISPRPYIWDEGVEWSSTYIILVWKYYIYYGDKNILSENYNAMKRYIGFLDSTAKNHILKQGWIGDWGSLVKGWQEGEPESVPTAFYYWNSKILSKIAKVLGKKIDSDYFSNKSEIIKDAYNKKYFDPKKKVYNNGSQMANVFPLFLGLVQKEYKEAVLNNLVDDIINKNNGHLTTGVLGSKYMIDALTMEGRADVAYLLATQTGYPSWSDMVEKYTTMCEFWTLKQSHNHVMTGSIDAFFYKTLAGINLDENYPGCEKIIIKPYIPISLPYVKASVETIRGRVSIDWVNNDSKLILKIEIPANMTAELFIPANERSNIFEGKTQADKSYGVKFLGSTEDYAHYIVNSGKYEFVVLH